MFRISFMYLSTPLLPSMFFSVLMHESPGYFLLPNIGTYCHIAVLNNDIGYLVYLSISGFGRLMANGD